MARTQLEQSWPFLNMIDKLHSYVCTGNKRWYVFFDQLDVFYSIESVVHKYIFSIIHVLNSKSRVTVVLSASANNEGHPFLLKNFRVYVMNSNQYSKAEYSQWCY
jgi:hypothetical protein